MSIKKQNAVVFGSSRNHTFAIACVMMDLRNMSPGLIDEVVIFHDGIKLSDQKIISTILPTRFIEYEFPLRGRKVVDSQSVKQFTKMVFTKFECLKLLDDYHNVLWLDYDIVIQKDIADLFLPSKNGIKMLPGGIKVKDQLLEEIIDYDMDREGICGSTFVFQDTLENYHEMYNFCYSKLEKYVEYLYLGEQAIFDFMIQEFNLLPESIDPTIYTPHPTDPLHAPSAKIIHSYGQPKFWNGLKNEQWDHNYQIWVSWGGSKNMPTKPISLPIRIVRKIKRIIFS